MSLSTDDSRFLSVARELATRAAAEIQQRLHHQHDLQHKADKSIVTEADMLSDSLIREGLTKQFPEHGLLTEETGYVAGKNSPYTWCIDPLDGTKAYAKAIPGYCVMVGLLKEGLPYLGVVVDPFEGHLYQAVRGHGATHYFRGTANDLRVTSRRQWKEMPLVISTGYPEDELNRIRAELPGPLLNPINSVGIKVGLIVRQFADIYLNHHPVHYWDTCAPQIILEEAGGRFSRWDGKALSYESENDFSHHSRTIATNGTQHEEIVQLLADFA